MAYQKMYDLLTRLSGMGKNVFTVNDAAKLTGKSTAYMSLLLSRSKRVHRIERGKYYLDGTDQLAIASNMIFPCYISMFSAFRYYDLTTQIPSKISVISTKRHGKLDVYGNSVEFRLLGTVRFFGYVKKNGVFMAEIEKAILDALYFCDPPYSYVVEAFHKAMENGILDPTRLKKYCVSMGSRALKSRLGFLLESEGVDANDLYPGSRRYVRIAGISPHKNRWRII